MKKILVISMVLVMLISFTGCVRVESFYKINKDNSGYNTITVAYNELVVEEMGLNPDIIMSEVYNVTNGLDRVKDAHYFIGELGYLVDNMQYIGESRLVYFDNIINIFNRGASRGNSIGYLENNQGANRIELEFTSFKPVSEQTVFDKLFIEAGGELLFSIEVDHKVTSHNATRVEGKKYIWDLIDVSKEPEKYGKLAFIEYEGNRGIQSVSRGASRRQVSSRVELEEVLKINNKTTDFHALALEKMGLLEGTHKGLELDRYVTRIEGAVLYSRLLGLDGEIQQFKTMNPNYESGFTDIPEWAEDIMNYLSYMNLVAGVSEGKYGSNDIMTENQYLTLVLRVLGYSEENGDFHWETAHETAEELGFYKEDFIPYSLIQKVGFTRGLMSYITYNSLFVENQESGIKLLDNYIK